MSTTVSYKNNTITTVSNSTKTLYTSGTWLEDDIHITDEESAVLLQQDENGFLILPRDGNSINATNLDSSGVVSFTNGELLKLDNNYALEGTVFRLTKQLTYNWDLTESLVDTISGATITLSGATQSSSGVTIASATQYMTIPVKYSKYMTYEFDIDSMVQGSLSTHGRLIMMSNSEGLIYRSGSNWSAYLAGSWATNSGQTASDLFAGHTLRMVTTNDAPKFYIDDTLFYSPNRTQSLTSTRNLTIGSPDGQGYFTIVITGIRVYEGSE